jgi:hypothetical protein
MNSFIMIPPRYDIKTVIGPIDIVCTGHSKPIVLRTIERGMVGVDEIMRLVEDHEQKSHQ